MATIITLTTGSDTVTGTASNDTVNGTTATLNAGDSLAGGAGTDVLALYGSGEFHVDQLSSFAGFESITLNNFTSGGAVLYLDSQSIAVTGYGSGSEQVWLGSGAVTFQGGSGYNNVYSTSASNWNAGNSIDGGSYGVVTLNANGFNNAVYDLTTNTLTHINNLQSYGTVTLKINSAVAAGVGNFSGYGTLTTSDAALDLSHSAVSGFTVASSNAAGTNFTVHDIGTAFQIAGGSGTDTITAQGFAFSADQRNAIFATASVEKIVDVSGTYTAPPQNSNVFTLTTGSDTVTGTASNDTVNGTTATLNAGDSLTGGAGTDVLALYGSGEFHVDQLSSFAGFESITLNNFTSGGAVLYLDSQSIAVTGYGSGSEQVWLGSGAATFQGGSGYNNVYSTSASNWNAGNSIDGGSYGVVTLNANGFNNAVYDLTTNTLTHINNLQSYGTVTLKINSAVAAGVGNFSGYGTLTTSDAALDLSHSAVSGFTVASSNAAGTNFTVHDIGTAFQIAGGSGTDTITAQGFAFSADQRNAIFATASVEKIVDVSGTYTAPNGGQPIPPDNPPQSGNVFTLTTAADTVTGTTSNDTVNGTAATLNAGDSLTGGAGIDVLALYGSGVFHVDQLATFTGLEGITLNNFTNGNAELYLGSQSIAVTGHGSGTEYVQLGSGTVTFVGGSGYNSVSSASASNWNVGNSIDGGSYGVVQLNTSWNSDATYDLTANTLTHINYLYGYGNANVTLQINSAAAAGVANFYGYGINARLVTSDAALDLSHSSVSGFSVVSTNATGTNFTVHDIGTAFQITGGSGSDTITAQGFAFSTDQRNAIFATASVERIVDASGTYTAPPQDPNVFTLTTAADTVTGTASNDTVNGTAATLNAGDSLTGGAGIDVLALYGSGVFHVDQLATFTGLEGITLNNFTNGNAELYLGSQSIAVTGHGSGTEYVQLGSGTVTFVGGSGYNSVSSASASNWNVGNSIDGGSYGVVQLNTSWNSDATYDLTANTLTHINYLYGYGNANVTLQINSAAAAGVANFYGYGINARLVTSDAALDLSHSSVSGFSVVSTNATGTNFTVHDIGTAFQITGGPGQDTIQTNAFAFTADQRNAIFATASVEKIIDLSGTYTAPPPSPGLTDVNDNAPVITTVATQTVFENTALVAALTSTDADTVGTTPATFSITGGADTALFDIVGGNLVFKIAPNYETDPHSYQVEVSAFDGVNITTKTITVNLTDVNDNAPVITAAATQSVAENSTFVAALTSTDADTVGTNPATISGGTNAALFDIIGGNLVFKIAPNYETNPHSYQVEVSAFDGANTTTKTITINLTDVNEVPTAVALANATAAILENTPTATHIKVADINVTDDALGTNTLRLTGTDATFFEIVGTELFLKTGTVLDFESKSSYAVAVTVDDLTVGATPDAVSTTHTLAVTNVPGVAINGTSGNDTIDAMTTVVGQPLPTNEEDVVYGGTGNDTIAVAGGNDFIDGGAGADTMRGGPGNDTYVVDNGGMPSLGWLASLLGNNFPGISTLIRGDVIVENANEGTDTVLTSVSFTLPTNVENLVLSGASNLAGTGNALSNVITGNAGNNALQGLAGADTLIGGYGNDQLIGGADADTLTGGPGSDRFGFTAISDSTVAAPDTIVGFVHGEDVIDFSLIDANSGQGGDQAFAFGGENTTVVNGVTWFESGGNTVIQADVSGDANADLQIILAGVSHNLTVTDFIL